MALGSVGCVYGAFGGVSLGLRVCRVFGVFRVKGFDSEPGSGKVAYFVKPHWVQEVIMWSGHTDSRPYKNTKLSTKRLATKQQAFLQLYTIHRHDPQTLEALEPQNPTP